MEGVPENTAPPATECETTTPAGTAEGGGDMGGGTDAGGGDGSGGGGDGGGGANHARNSACNCCFSALTTFSCAALTSLSVSVLSAAR